MRSYDQSGRVQSETTTLDGQSYVVGSGYDALGRLASVTYPGGSQVVRTYTPRSQLESVSLDDASVAGFGYDAVGRETTRTFGNGVVENRTWRNDNLVENIAAPGVSNFTYAYDANKRKTQEADGILSARTQNFDYDNQDRMTSWNRPGIAGILPAQETFNLTPVGDMSSVVKDGVTETRENNRVHEIGTINGQQVVHDAKGNLTVDPKSGQTYTWDEENRLVSAKRTSDSVVLGSYKYDALGRRVQKVTDEGTRTYVLSGAQIVQEYLGTVLERSYFIPPQQCA